MGALLTQAVGLGFVSSPRWGSPAHTSTLSLAGSWRAASQSVGWRKALRSLSIEVQQHAQLCCAPATQTRRWGSAEVAAVWLPPRLFCVGWDFLFAWASPERKGRGGTQKARTSALPLLLCPNCCRCAGTFPSSALPARKGSLEKEHGRDDRKANKAGVVPREGSTRSFAC
jgi:hypothetical protein